MAFYCTHCGSRNHRAIDCSKKHLTYTPTPEELAQMEGPRAPTPPAPLPAAVTPRLPSFTPNTSPPPPGTPVPLIPHPFAHQGYRPTCTVSGEAAYESEAQINTLAKALCTDIVRIWQCGDHYHWEPKHHSPAGDSSGTGRSSPTKPNLKYFIRPAFLAQIRKAHSASVTFDLPQQQPQAPPATPAKKIVAPAPTPALKCGGRQEALL